MTAGLVTSVFRGRSLALAGLALAAMVSTTAQAATIFTSNLSNITTPAGCTTCSGSGSNFQLNYLGGTVAGFTNTFSSGTTLGFNFVYSSPSSAFLVGAYNQGNSQSFKLDNAVIADAADSQDGGYFLALDSIFNVAPIISIPIPTILGNSYVVSFDWAGTQAAGVVNPGITSDFLSVSLGGSPAQVTGSLVVQPQGFTGCGNGWCSKSDTFVATTTGTETLTFLAGGTPAGNGLQPAITLLDNISVSTTNASPTPEPSSLMLLSTGLVGLGGFLRWRLKNEQASV